MDFNFTVAFPNEYLFKLKIKELSELDCYFLIEEYKKLWIKKEI